MSSINNSQKQARKKGKSISALARGTFALFTVLVLVATTIFAVDYFSTYEHGYDEYGYVVYTGDEGPSYARHYSYDYDDMYWWDGTVSVSVDLWGGVTVFPGHIEYEAHWGYDGARVLLLPDDISEDDIALHYACRWYRHYVDYSYQQGFAAYVLVPAPYEYEAGGGGSGHGISHYYYDNYYYEYLNDAPYYSYARGNYGYYESYDYYHHHGYYSNYYAQDYYSNDNDYINFAPTDGYIGIAPAITLLPVFATVTTAAQLQTQINAAGAATRHIAIGANFQITQAGGITVPANRHIILSSAGTDPVTLGGTRFTLTAPAGHATLFRRHFNLTGAGSSLTLVNLVLCGTGYGVIAGAPDQPLEAFRGGVNVENQSRLIMEHNSVIQRNRYPGTDNGVAVHLFNGHFTMNGGEIRYHTAVQWGVVAMYHNAVTATPTTRTSFTMNGGEIHSNDVPSTTGAVVRVSFNNPLDHRSYSTMTMNGGTIRNNTGAGGRGVRVVAGRLFMNGGTIRNNNVSAGGAGVYLVGGSSFMTMTGGIIENNEAGNGGGIRVGTGASNPVNWFGTGNSPTLTINATTSTVYIRNNLARVVAGGGGIINVNGNVTINGPVNIQGNTRGSAGGAAGIAQQGGTMTIGNTGGPVNIREHRVAGTGAANNGAAVHQTGGTINMYSHTTIYNNRTANANIPGGVYVNGATAIFNMRGGVIHNNQGTTGGGGVRVGGGIFRMYNNAAEKVIRNNEGTTGGGGVGVFGDGARFYMYNNSRVEANIASSGNNGAAIHINAGHATMNSGSIVRRHNADGGPTGVAGGTDNGGPTAAGSAVRIAAGATSTFTMNPGSSIVSNRNPFAGGVMQATGLFNMNGGTIGGPGYLGNQSTTSGGGVRITGTSTATRFYMRGTSTITNNTANEAGGGVARAGTQHFNFLGGTISNNTAPIGGGIHAINGPVNISGTGEGAAARTISGNTADTDGGGVWLAAGATLTAQNTAFTNNIASNGEGVNNGMGGAIFTANHQYADPLTQVNVYNNIVIQSGTTFSGNQAYAAYQPPGNAAAWTGIPGGGTNQQSQFNHPINNRDINFRPTEGGSDPDPDWIRLNNAINNHPNNPTTIIIHPAGGAFANDTFVLATNTFNLVVSDPNPIATDAGRTITTLPLSTTTGDPTGPPAANPHRIRIPRAVTIQAVAGAEIILRMPVEDSPNTANAAPWNVGIIENINRHFIVEAAGDLQLGAPGSGTLTLDGNAVIGATVQPGNRGGVQIIAADMVMEAGSIIRNCRGAFGGGIYITGIAGNAGTVGSDVVLRGGAIVEDNFATSGGGIFVGSNNQLELYNGIIRNNAADSNGGGINMTNINGAYAIMRAPSQIYGNRAIAGTGGGVVVGNVQNRLTPPGPHPGTSATQRNPLLGETVFTMHGGSIHDNFANLDGGGIRVGIDGYFNMHGGAIDGNWSGRRGGGVEIIEDSTFTWTGGSITNNGRHPVTDVVTTQHGGGLSILGGAQVTIFGSAEKLVAYNESIYQGGGIFLSTTGLDVQNVSMWRTNRETFIDIATGTNIIIHDNETGEDGGGIYLENNAFEQGAGNLLNFGASLTLNSGIIHSNIAGEYGGGIAIREHSDDPTQVVTLTLMPSSHIYNNTAGYGGGGVAAFERGEIIMHGGTIGGPRGCAADCDDHANPLNCAPNLGNTALDGGGVWIGGGARFYMQDYSPAVPGTGVIEGNHATRASNSGSAGGGGVFMTDASTTFHMRAGTIRNNVVSNPATLSGLGGGVSVVDGSRFYLHGGEIYGNENAFRGGGVYITRAVPVGQDFPATAATASTFTMNGGIIRNNTSNWGGGVANMEHAQFNMHGGYIRNNHAIGEGPVVIVGGGVVNISMHTGSASLNMTGGTIEGNTSLGGAGGMWINPANMGWVPANDTYISITGGTIRNNIAHGEGEGAGPSGFSYNGGGGGIFFTSEPRHGTTFGGSTLQIYGNRAYGETGGGGIKVHAQHIVMTEGVIRDNFAYEYGGGVLVFPLDDQLLSGGTPGFTMQGGVIHSNDADRGGGVAALGGGVVNMHAGTIGGPRGCPSNCTVHADAADCSLDQGNRAIYGGGVWAGDGATFNIHGGGEKRITGNNADYGGGVFLAWNAAATPAIGGEMRMAAGATNVNITNNIAEYDGGGIFTQDYEYEATLSVNGGNDSIYYRNLTILPGASFSNNFAGRGSFAPPSNYYTTDIDGTGTSPTITAHQVHQLNNFDVNFRRGLSTFQFYKTDHQDNLLAGAHFRLYRTSATNLGVSANYLITAANSTGVDPMWVNVPMLQPESQSGNGALPVSFSMTPGFTYQLMEIQPPSGFQMPMGQWRVVANDSPAGFTVTPIGGAPMPNILYVCDCTGECTGSGNWYLANWPSFNLPQAGGMGALVYSVAGTLFLGFAFVAIIVSTKRAVKRAKM